MDEQENIEMRPVNPRRRKRSQLDIFKEAYLPVLIAGVAVLLIIIFIIGSISRSIQKRQDEKDANIAASASAQDEYNRLRTEADKLIAEAAALADKLDYQGAINTLSSFTGDAAQFKDVYDALNNYKEKQASLQLWDDPSQVVNLSFQVLIADGTRAFTNASLGSKYNSNFITTSEFTAILEELYANDYILVSLDDIYTTVTTEIGTSVYEAKPLYLPAGKKPLILTQTQVNYYTYMIDSNDDGLPDKNGAGFASKLLVNEDGKFVCEMVDKNGQTVVGNYDMVPILETFISAHPDFSYQGARAVLAVTGFDGLFGYRTNTDANAVFNHDQEVQGAQEIIDALRSAGYELACYTYENVGYGVRSASEIKTDLSKWASEVTPILGETDILVYAQLSDLTNGDGYGGEKHNVLQNAGFRFYLGFCNDGASWSIVEDNYVRQGRIMVTGANLVHHAEWFNGIFDATSVIDANRPSVPAN